MKKNSKLTTQFQIRKKGSSQKKEKNRSQTPKMDAQLDFFWQ
jgi:hypothetical protein